MRFYLIRCEDHGTLLRDEGLRESTETTVSCIGHKITRDTSDLPLYEAERADIPIDAIEGRGISDEEAEKLIRKAKVVNYLS
jgi:hypothetical protein